MKSGMVWINCYKRVSRASPFRGVGASGYGREMGFEAMHEYTEVKSVRVSVVQTCRHTIRASGSAMRDVPGAACTAGFPAGGSRRGC